MLPVGTVDGQCRLKERERAASWEHETRQDRQAAATGPGQPGGLRTGDRGEERLVLVEAGDREPAAGTRAVQAADGSLPRSSRWISAARWEDMSSDLATFSTVRVFGSS